MWLKQEAEVPAKAGILLLTIAYSEQSHEATLCQLMGIRF